MQRHGFDGNTDLYQAKTKENKMLFLYSPDNNTRYFHLHTGKIHMKKPKSANCKLSQYLFNVYVNFDVYINPIGVLKIYKIS